MSLAFINIKGRFKIKNKVCIWVATLRYLLPEIAVFECCLHNIFVCQSPSTLSAALK